MADKDTGGVTESLIIDILGRDTSDEAMVLGDNVLYRLPPKRRSRRMTHKLPRKRCGERR